MYLFVQKNKIKIFSIIIYFLLLAFSPLITNAATLSISPREGTFHKGENFNVDVLISSDTSVNAFSSIVSFPTDVLNITSISKSNSIIDLWTQNPSFSNAGSMGNASFEGVVLSPGFIGPKGKILTLNFRVKNEGSANITFSEYAVLENDGLGTNAVVSIQGAYFTFLPPKPVAEKSDTLPIVRDVVVVREVETNKLLSTWNFLPKWIKTCVLLLIGITTIFLLLLIISFGIVTLIWLWGYLRKREYKITRWFEILPKFGKRFSRKVPSLLESIIREIKGDIKYSIHQFKNDIKEAEDNNSSLPKVLSDFWASVKRIVKRFLTRNEKK